MTFNEWEESRKESLAIAQKNIAILQAQRDSELSKLFGDSFETAMAEEVREYTKAIAITSMEEDLFQIAVLLKELKEELKDAPRVMLKKPEQSRFVEWIPCKIDDRIDHYECSDCARSQPIKTSYCSHCGAKMFIKVDDALNDIMKDLVKDNE